jgi:predicted DNA-binding WGR domain protein
MSTYYLEYSEEEASGTSHKFYEATVDGTSVTLCYGRIGTPGASTSQQCDSPKADEPVLKRQRVGAKFLVVAGWLSTTRCVIVRF